MIHELSENVFSWKGLRIHTVRVSDDYIRGSIPMARTKGAARSDHAPAADGSIYLKIEEAFLYQFRTLTLAGLARGVGLSERQLQRLLRERYDQTFTQKRTEARMRAANLLLAEGRLPITRIAGEVGYSGPEHFCAEYKKYMGMTAREYRRQNTRP